MADALASGINQNLTTWRSAPSATEIERLVIDWIRQLVGLPGGWGGYLTSNGSLANLSALAVARCMEFPGNVRDEGLQSLSGRRMLVYASTEVHGSIQKAADMLGLGQQQARLIAVDRSMQMRVREQVSRSVDSQPLAPGELSIACFRYIPAHLKQEGESANWEFTDTQENELNTLNSELLLQLQRGGGFYPSSTRINGKEAVRVCIVNYLAEESDMDALMDEIRACGEKIHGYRASKS